MITRLFKAIPFILLFSSVVSATENNKQTNELTLAAGLAKPPYISEEQTHGYELELINNIFAALNIETKYVFVPYGRSGKLLSNAEIDGLLTMNSNLVEQVGFLTDSYITYQNVAVSMTKNNFEIDKISSLAAYSLATFQSAHKVLGEDFAKASAKSPLYTQVANQERQLELLFKERVDVIILDVNIFHYLLKESEYADKGYTIHPLFKPNPYRLALKSEELTKAFNQSWRAFRKTQAYKALRNKYHITTQ